MKVNLNNIRDTYGDNVVLLIRDNIDIINNNIIDLNKVFSKLKTQKNIKYVLKVLVDLFNVRKS